MKTKKNALIVLCAIAISTVSCVDDTLSPQVEAIRAQQVEWMKAKTNFEIALADMKKSDSEVSIAQNKILLQIASNNLAIAVANSGDNLAQEYLKNYNIETNTLVDLYPYRVIAQNNYNTAISSTILQRTKELEAINAKITAQEKIVAYWKGLLDKIFTA